MVIINRVYEWRYIDAKDKSCPEHGTVVGLANADEPFYFHGYERSKNPTHLVCEDADGEVFLVPLKAIENLTEVR